MNWPTGNVPRQCGTQIICATASLGQARASRQGRLTLARTAFSTLCDLNLLYSAGRNATVTELQPLALSSQSAPKAAKGRGAGLPAADRRPGAQWKGGSRHNRWMRTP